MVAALAIGTALQTIPSRNADPLDSLVVSLTMFHGGSATNVIPEEITMGGTVRSYTAKTRDMAEARIRAILSGQAESYGVSVDLSYQRSYPATVNHAAQVAKSARVAEEVVGADKVDADTLPDMGAEDFSYMLEHRPGAFYYIGQGLGPALHHPEFNFNDETAPIGASFFARLVERLQPVG